jgi:hypothetical protein
MSNTSVGCLRRHNLSKWERDVVDAETFEDDSRLRLCWDCKNMEHERLVENLSSFMVQEFKCNLDMVKSSAILPYILLPEITKQEKDFKYKVLECIVTAIKTKTNPVNGKKFGKDGLTEYIVKSIIRYKRTGHIIPERVEICTTLTPVQIRILNDVLKEAERKQLDDSSIKTFTTISKIRKLLINQRVKDTCKGEY